ncbi:uncharacterized protein IWZ02DRAFT_268777 [Phyllosticta citriasiana]|uniref:uncharacterized protein n=1 Tax=Phyllosticta citriasiana TaxID=595635 RepID=UPI0030FD24AB
MLENIDRLGCFACLPAGDWLLPRRVSISLLVTGFYVLLMKNSVLSARYEDLAIRVRAVENFLYRSNDVENGFCKLRGRGEDCCRHTVSWSRKSLRSSEPSIGRRQAGSIAFVLVNVSPLIICARQPTTFIEDEKRDHLHQILIDCTTKRSQF